MKTKLRTGFTVIAFTVMSVIASAQSQRKTPWASDKGYWVTESNLNEPGSHIIRFYTGTGLLVYTETVRDMHLDPGKRRTKIKLKEALEAVMEAWQQNKQPGTGQGYVAVRLRQDRKFR
jgi:hypothetical protein